MPAGSSTRMEEIVSRGAVAVGPRLAGNSTADRPGKAMDHANAETQPRPQPGQSGTFSAKPPENGVLSLNYGAWIQTNIQCG